MRRMLAGCFLWSWLVVCGGAIKQVLWTICEANFKPNSKESASAQLLCVNTCFISWTSKLLPKAVIKPGIRRKSRFYLFLSVAFAVKIGHTITRACSWKFNHVNHLVDNTCWNYSDDLSRVGLLKLTDVEWIQLVGVHSYLDDIIGAKNLSQS